MSLLGKLKVARISLFLVALSFYSLSGYAEVTVSGNYYCDAAELTEFISVENAGFVGKVAKDPLGIPISSEGSGHTNSNVGSAPIKANSILQMKHKDQTVTAESNIEAKSSFTEDANVEWGHKVLAGHQRSAMNLYTDITTFPGILTYPTTKEYGVITTGMKLNAHYLEDGQPVSVTRYVPPKEFSDYPVTLGVGSCGDDSVHMEINLAISAALT